MTRALLTCFVAGIAFAQPAPRDGGHSKLDALLAPKPTSRLTELCTVNGKNICEEAKGKQTPLQEAHVRCEKGDLQGCTDEGSYTLATTKSADGLARAATLFTRACDGHYEIACGGLGLMLATGLGVTKDLQKAVPLLARGCAVSGGMQEPCARLGDAYWAGTGVERAPQKAVDAYQRACDAGDRLACNNLVKILRGGMGVAPDLERAFKLADKTCAKGDAAACELTAEALLQGKGVNRDIPWGVTLLKKACDGNSMEACTLLGGLMLQGAAVPLDAEGGKALLKRACERGNTEACAMLK